MKGKIKEVHDVKTVTIIQRGIAKYRLSFYEALKKELATQDIRLTLVHGNLSRFDQCNKYCATVPWAVVIKNRVIKVFGKEVHWQPVLNLAIGSDLVIVEQANRLIINPILLALRKIFGFKLAFWGHGKNYQSTTPRGLLERYKRAYSNHADWWFAYTDLSAEILRETGFPPEKITIVQNAVETNILKAAFAAVTPMQLNALKKGLGLQSDRVCLYCGSMYPDKKLDFLLEACVAIRTEIPDFEMIFVGPGPDQYMVESAARQYPWIHYVGPKFGVERVPYFMLSKALLVPGVVGLVIVDSFVTCLPMFTTDIPTHSPEIAYLIQGVNGVMTSYAVEAYSSAVAEYLKNEAMQAALREGCRRSATIYTLENMVDNFTQGIKKCLSA
jgi:glycosyltransferase involved in cell wall biosynthesis